MKKWKISAQHHAESIANAPENEQKLYSRISQDFEPWQGTGITQEMVEHAYCTVRFFSQLLCNNCVRLLIQASSIIQDLPRLHHQGLKVRYRS